MISRCEPSSNVTRARVTVRRDGPAGSDEEVTGAIGPGLVALVGVTHADTA
ncbi:MAG: D-aminoacyl-tRNA deacylase [Acidimicrobiales bacterium]